MNRPSFLYLNRDGDWPDFRRVGLEAAPDGTLHLVTLPLLVEGAATYAAMLPPSDAPGGVAVADDGRVFWSDPERKRVLWRDSCDGAVAALPCLGAGAPIQAPHGLAIHPKRRSLMVADPATGQVWLLSADAAAIAEGWPMPTGSDGGASRPFSLAVLDDHVYVLDLTSARVHKLTLWGLPVVEFATAISAGNALQRPTAVAAHDGEIFVLDAGRGAMIVFDEEGAVIRSFDLAGVQDPMGLAVGRQAVFVGDNASRGVIQFSWEGDRIGRAIGYQGPVTALVLTATEDLWLSPGHGAVPLRFAARGGYIRQGVLWGGPFGFGDTAHLWGRLSALGTHLAPGAHFRFLTVVTNTADVPPAPALGPGPGPSLTPWIAGPPDAPDIYLGDEAHFLWVAAVFAGDGMVSPRLDQIRVDVDHDTYSRYLPPLYIREPDQKRMVDRFLALFESHYVDVETGIAELARLFDAGAAPAAWLEWLAGWLAVPLPEDWPEEKKRQAIGRAVEVHRWRGTARGLEDALRFELGIRAVVEEPIVHSEWWGLPGAGADDSPLHETSRLGHTTMLVAGPPEGAVLGTTATLDHSHIITDAEFGAPLFSEVAHRFSIYVYRPAAVDSRLLDQVRTVLDREKPAHTAYRVCVVEPVMRVGHQAILGIDTVVAGGPPQPTVLGRESAPSGLVLGGDPLGRLGARAVVGKTSRLGEGTVGAG